MRKIILILLALGLLGFTRIDVESGGGGGGGTPAGDATQLQYNNAGTFGGTAGVNWSAIPAQLQFYASDIKAMSGDPEINWTAGVLHIKYQSTCGANDGLCIDSDDFKLYRGTDEVSASAGGAASGHFYTWQGGALQPLQASDALATLDKDLGTNADNMNFAFDASTDECVMGNFKLPGTVDTSGTVTFYAHWYSKTATSGDVIWDFRWNVAAEGESWDAALTTETAAADAVQGTVDQITITSWTETMSTLAWAAGEEVRFNVCRDADNGSGDDDLVGDAQLITFSVNVP